MPLFGSPDVEKLKARGDVKGLVKALGYKKDATVRRDAVKALADVAGDQARHPLVLALQDEDAGVRQSAAEALGDMADGRAVEPMVAALQDEAEDVREAAATSLGQIGAQLADAALAAQVVKALILTLKDGKIGVQSAARKSLEAIGAPSVAPLFAVLQDHSSELPVRRAAVYALGEIGQHLEDANLRQRIIEQLFAALEHKDVCDSAADELREISPHLEDAELRRQAVEALILAFGRYPSFVIARALGEMSAPLEDEQLRQRVVEALIAQFSGGGEDVARALGMACARLDDAELSRQAVEWLMADLKATSESERFAAADALAMIGAPAAAPLLARLGDLVPLARKAAIRALGGIGVQLEDAALRMQVMEALAGVARDDEAKWIRDAAVGALGRIGAHLKEAKQRQWVVETLITALQDEHDGIRVAAASALGEIGDAQAVEPLIAALQDKYARVREAAAEALGQFDDSQASQALAEVREKEAVRVSVPAVLFVAFRDSQPPMDTNAFVNELARALFPQYLKRGQVGIYFEVDQAMPRGVDSGKDPFDYGFGMTRLVMATQQVGLGELDPEGRHTLAWSGYTDAHGGRGIIYAVLPKE